jgi:hypothetical protein
MQCPDAVPSMQHSNGSNRINRLPISRYHKIPFRRLIKLSGVTINQAAYVTSLSFVGMFFRSEPFRPQSRRVAGARA